ncbi:MAG: hypothetical protein NTZ94_03810 [Verrucomicrobia bacterium]|nr:hypothetical protein [Verrucomicrobiota bacterium]
MTMSVSCYSSFTLSYLSRAILLARTLRQAHPTWELWAVITDKLPPEVDLSEWLVEFDHVIFSDQLEIPRFNAWIFKHDVVEASTAVKGTMLRILLERGADIVVYLDPDIAVFHPLDSVIKKLDYASILLTPHQVQPNLNEGEIRDNELTSLKYGIFNLGFLAVRNDVRGRAFANWWESVLIFACYDEPHNGFFTDQKWCDLVPALFEGVCIEQDPGCNVASWNLTRRQLVIARDGGILVNGSPLKFYHFTKINREGDLMTERYSGDNVEVIEIWKWYKRMLQRVVVSSIPKGYWHYGKFNNNVTISKKLREFYRSRKDVYEHFDDPFCTEGASLWAWLGREQPELLEDDGIGGFQPI